MTHARCGGVIAALCLALVLAGCGLFRDASDFIGDTYPRAAGLDQGTARAFTADDAPPLVVDRIASAVSPLDTIRGSTASYLQYKNYLVRVAPVATTAGSLIQIDNYGNGYRRWASDVASQWGATPPDDDDGK